MVRTLSGATTPSQCGPGRYGNKGVFHIPQSSSITGASPSDCLVSYQRHSLGESYPSAETQLVYPADPDDWTSRPLVIKGHSAFCWSPDQEPASPSDAV